MLGTGQVAALIDDGGPQTTLHGIGQVVVFDADLAIECDQLLRELLRHAGCEILLGETLRTVGAVRPPDVDRQIGEARVDVDRHIGEHQMILRLRDITPGIVDLHLAAAFQRRLPHRADLAGEPAMHRQVIVLRPYVDRRTETRMRHGAMIAFEIILQHRLPVGVPFPLFPRVEHQRIKVDAALAHDLQDLAVLLAQRRRATISVDEDPRPECLDAERQQRIILQPEARFVRGARCALQAAREIVGPRMVAALHDGRIAATLHHLMPAVAADIDQRVQPGFAADHHHRDQSTDISGDIVADILQFVRRTDIGPALGEYLPQFALRDRRIGVPARRQRQAAVETFDQRRRVIDRLTYRLFPFNCCAPGQLSVG